MLLREKWSVFFRRLRQTDVSVVALRVVTVRLLVVLTSYFTSKTLT